MLCFMQIEINCVSILCYFYHIIIYIYCITITEVRENDANKNALRGLPDNVLKWCFQY